MIPQSLTIDEFDGSAFVGLVPFVVESARPVGAPRSVGLQFLETNVRTYVRLDGGREPGRVSSSLDAASLLAVLGARVSLGLPYFWAAGHLSQGDYRLRRRLGRRPGCQVRYEVGEYLGTAQPGSLDEFLIERYHLHVQRGPTLWTVRVWHPPYPLHHVRLQHLDDQLVAAAGVQVLGEPPLVHFASGVDVAILPPSIRPLILRLRHRVALEVLPSHGHGSGAVDCALTSVQKPVSWQ